MNISSFAAALFSRYPTLFVGNIVLALILMVVDAATLASVAPVISLITNEGGSDSVSPIIARAVQFVGLDGRIEVFLSIFVFLTVLNSVMLVTINYFILRTQFIVRNDMVVGTSEKVILASMNYINRQRQGDFLNTLTQEAARVADAFTALTRLIAPIGQTIILLIIPFAISWQVTGIALAATLTLTLPLRALRKHSYSLGQEQTQSANNMSATLQEALQNLRQIAAFANEDQTLSRIRRAFARVRDASIKIQMMQSSIYSAYAPIGVVVIFITFLASRKLGVELAEVGVILYAFNRLAGTLASINQSRLQLINLYPSYEQVMTIRDDADRSRLTFGAKSHRRLEKEIRLEGVSFYYDAKQPVVSDIDLTIPAGNMVALVGLSGAGKSTLADMVMGLQKPTSGRILVDGVPLDEIDIASYRQTMACVPQHPALFHMSVRDNIAWAAPGAGEQDILAACRLANADKFVAELDEGLDTVVGDRGVRLSGGQLQRIALARAMIRNPSLLILDEATSALDSGSEAAIQDSIDGIVGETTILVIAHRLSTIAKADKIVVLEKGRIIEQGTFNELVAQNGSFTKLVEIQKLTMN